MNKFAQELSDFDPISSIRRSAYIIKRLRMTSTSKINVTKLQKILYCCYGAVLGAYHRVLLDERPEAWSTGPIFPFALKVMQTLTIDEISMINTNDVECLPLQMVQFLNSVIDFFGQYTGEQLASWSRRCTPWKSAGKYEIINNEAITDYFATQIEIGRASCRERV